MPLSRTANNGRDFRYYTALGRAFGAVSAFAGPVFVTPAYAQAAGDTDDPISAELEALVDAAQSPDSAIAAARQQMADNDLTGAASTLEGALLNDRNADEVRALYATVMCQLDDQKGAAVEIGRLDAAGLSGSSLSELRTNCGAITNPAASSGDSGSGATWWGSASAGLAYDNDSIGGITLQFFFTPMPTGRPISGDGLSLTNSADINVRSDPGNGDNYFYGAASIDSKVQIAGGQIFAGPVQYQFGEVRFGLGGSSGSTEYNIGPVFRHGRIYNDPYVNEYGVQVGAAFQSGTNSQILVDAEIVEEDFTANVNGNPFTDGLKISFSLASLTYTDEAGSYFYFGAEGQYKDADFRDYTSGGLFAAAKFSLDDKGTYAKVNAAARYVDYKASFTNDRKDLRLYGRGAIGIPLNDDGFHLEGGVSYTLRDSNDAAGVFDYDSFGADIKLVWTF